MENCVFCRIVRGEIPSRKVYEDDVVLAFHDINPVTPVHFLIIPKLHVASLADCGPSHELVLGRMLSISGLLAREQGLQEGFRSIINTGRIGRQDVYHLHMHVVGGPDPLPAMIGKTY